jgi:hypothetical protein
MLNPRRRHMGIDDYTKKAQAFLGSDQVKNALKSEQAEGASDKLLDSVADAAKKVTGGKFDSQIENARDGADKAVGNE